MTLDSDDRIWVKAMIELAVRSIVDACGKDGIIAQHNFRVDYETYRRTGMTRPGAAAPTEGQ